MADTGGDGPVTNSSKFLNSTASGVGAGVGINAGEGAGVGVGAGAGGSVHSGKNSGHSGHVIPPDPSQMGQTASSGSPQLLHTKKRDPPQAKHDIFFYSRKR